MAALLPPIPPDPVQGSIWQTVLVIDASGAESARIALYVPARGHRCDQHADASGALLTATDIGRRVAAAIRKRPSLAAQADMRRGGLCR
jgi:hypothetical protein